MGTWLKVVAGATVLGIAALLAWRYARDRALVRGETWTESLDGAWVIEYHDSALSHSGANAKLWRSEGGRRKVVDELVFGTRSIGDDCVVYGSFRGTLGRQFLAACGDRLPVLLAGPTYDDWRIDVTGLTRYVAPGEKGIIEQIPIADVKKRALAQPNFRDEWYRANEK